MRVAGIIAEYNPLHNGHIYHIEQTRQKTGCNYVLVVLSGGFVQRGEPAIADKFTRTQWALQAGADLVLELPAICALSSAERFAYGGVRIIAATGVVDYLSFGSEHANIEQLYDTASLLLNETPEFNEALKLQLSLGKSYPRARYEAWAACGAADQTLEMLQKPNSILGLEYLRFLRQLAPSIQPVAIARTGGSHNKTDIGPEYASATAIRNALATGNKAAYLHVPAYVRECFELGRQPITLADAEQIILYALRRMPLEKIAQLPDVGEGFENALFTAAKNATTLDELLSTIKSKRYTLARCKRILLCAVLEIFTHHTEMMQQNDALFLRLLGYKKSALPLLSAIGKNCTLPLIVRHADVQACSKNAQTILELDCFAHSVYSLLCRQNPPPADFSKPPVIL